MASVTYEFEKIITQLSKKGRKSLSAQQMAMMTRRYGNSALENDDFDDGREKKMTVKDDTTDSKRASWFGFSSWVGGLFSENIIFSFNGTQIKGKADHQVRGGAVPLFNGVVLDLTPASMTGRSEEGRQSVYPSKVTDAEKPKGGVTPAKLVVSPTNYSFMTEHTIADFKMEAPREGEVDVFSATIHEPIHYAMRYSGVLEADGAEVEKNSMKLENPRIVQGEDKINYETAEVNGQGIFLGDEKEEVRDEENNSESNGEGNGDNEEGGERSYVDSKNGAAALNSEENGANVNLQTGDVGVNNGDLEITGNIFKGTFKLGFGKDWSSDKEEGDKEEKESEQTETDKAVKEAIQEYFDGLQEKSKDALGKLGFAGEALIHFFKTGKLPENPCENEEENKNDETKLTASVPILAPFLNFEASLIPIWRFGFHVGFEIAEGEKPKLKVNENNGRIIVSCGNIKRRIILTGNLRGKIGAKLKLALAAGLGYLFDISAGLFAEGVAKGILDGGGEDIFGKARLEIPVTLGDEGMKIGGDDQELLTIDAGIGLEGKVGAEASVESTLFGWEKDLFSYTFATWKPAELRGMFKLRKVKGAYGNKTSWKREASSFEFRFFQKSIEGSERYGIKLASVPKRINLLTREGKLTRDKIEELHKTLLGIEETIQSSKGGQYGSKDSEAYRDLKNQLKGIYEHFYFLAVMGESCFDQIAQELQKYEDDPKYKESLQVAEAKIQKHEKRKEGMVKWGEQFGEGEKKGAYEYYKGTFDGKQAEKLKEQARTETAKNSVATKEALIAYETKRILVLGKKSDERIKKLEERIRKIENMPEEKREVMNRELVDEYKEKNDKELLRYARQFAGRELITKYEKESEAEYGGKHLTRVRLLEAWLKDNSVSDKNKPNRAFAEYYHNKADAEFKEGLGAKRFFRPEVLLEYHQNGEKILKYEKERLKSKAGAYIERIEALESAKKNNTAIKYEGDLGKRFQLRLDTAKAASKVEILAYEREKAENKDQRLKKEKDYDAVKKVLEAMKRGEEILCGEGHQLKFSEIRRAASIFTDYKKKLSEKPKDMSSEDISIFRETVTLDVLQEYNSAMMREIERKENGKLPRKSEDLEQIWKEKEAEFMKSSYKDEIELDSTLGKEAKRNALYYTLLTDHEYVSHVLWNKRMEDMKKGSADMTDSERKSAQQMLKGEFFSYYLLDKDEKLNDNGQAMMKRLHQGTLLDTDELKMALYERYLEEFADVHVERYANLRKFMGLKKLENGETAEKAEEEEQARRSSKTDTQVWDYYRSLGAGRGFAEEYVNKKNRNFSIDDMLRYEQYEARAHSGRNAFKALIQKGAIKLEGEFLSQEGADEQLKEFDRQREEGNHYDRYCRLKEAVESKKSNKEIMEIYRGLGGGNGYAEYLTDKDMRILDEVTPQEILNYENTWKGEEGEVHKTRLAKIHELKKDLSPEEFYKAYRKIVLEESVYRRAWDKLTKGRSGIDFDESMDAETALTPEIILQYEKKCRDDIIRKHQDRLDHLQQADVTDEDALQVYREEGGGKAFFREKSTELSLAKAMLGESADYENILKYEDTRIKYYEKAKNEIEDAVKNIKKEQTAMSEKIETAKTDMERVKRILDSFESNPLYSNPDTFTEFRKEALGPDIQEGVEQVADIDKVSEREEEELDRLKEAQMKLLLDEELFLIDNV